MWGGGGEDIDKNIPHQRLFLGVIDDLSSTDKDTVPPKGMPNSKNIAFITSRINILQREVEKIKPYQTEIAELQKCLEELHVNERDKVPSFMTQQGFDF